MTSEQPSYWVMLQELMQLCARHNIQVNSIKREAQGKEYDIALTWVEPRHDGSKCRKLPIEEESKPLHNLTCVTDPSAEEPDADNEVPVKAKEIKVGQELYYYGPDKTKLGKKCKVMAVGNNGYSNTIQFEDNCTYNQISCTQLRRKVNGA